MISDAEVDDFFCRSVAALDAWLTPERLREINASTEKRKNPFDPPESRCLETKGWPIDETISSAETVGDSASIVGAANGKVRPILKGSINKVASGLESNEVTAPAGPVQYRKTGAEDAVDYAAVKTTGADDDLETDSFEDCFFSMFSDASCIPVPAYKQLNSREDPEPEPSSSSSLEADLSSVSLDRSPPPNELRIVDSAEESVRTIDASSDHNNKRTRFRVKWLTRCRNCFHRRKSSSVRSTRMTASSSSSSSSAAQVGCVRSGPLRRAAPPSALLASGGRQSMSPSFSSEVASSVCRLESTTDQPMIRSEGGVSFSLPLEKRNNCHCPAYGFCSTDSVSRQCSPLRSILKRSSWRSTVDGMPPPPPHPHPHPPLHPPPPPPSSAEASKESGRLSLVCNLKKCKVGKTSKPLRANHGLDPWTLGFPITWSFICNPDFSVIDMHLS